MDAEERVARYESQHSWWPDGGLAVSKRQRLAAAFKDCEREAREEERKACATRAYEWLRANWFMPIPDIVEGLKVAIEARGEENQGEPA